jgi:hypothetical protein
MQRNHLYVLNAEIARPVCLVVRGSEEAWLWHMRYGHLNFPVLRKLGREEMVHGLPVVDHVDQVCSSCLVGMQCPTQFPHQAEYQVEDPMELVHGDLCGPIAPVTPTRSRYFILLIDDCSCYMWLRTLRSKDQVADMIKLYQQVAKGETGRKLRAFRIDHHGEFTSTEFTKHCVKHGM